MLNLKILSKNSFTFFLIFTVCTNTILYITIKINNKIPSHNVLNHIQMSIWHTKFVWSVPRRTKLVGFNTIDPLLTVHKFARLGLTTAPKNNLTGFLFFQCQCFVYSKWWKCGKAKYNIIYIIGRQISMN